MRIRPCVKTKSSRAASALLSMLLINSAPHQPHHVSPHPHHGPPMRPTVPSVASQTSEAVEADTAKVVQQRWHQWENSGAARHGGVRELWEGEAMSARRNRNANNMGAAGPTPHQGGVRSCASTGESEVRARTNSTCLQQDDAARATSDEGLCSRAMRSGIIGHNLYATPLVLAASFIQQSIIDMAEARPRLGLRFRSEP